ncbi:MAG: 3'-5' exonuclease [Bacteriovoracaceae bacterium]|nr:3'-5' exonuclease [Bacteriovoracaceae bacterium]
MEDQNSVELVDSLKFCVIDLETTGGNPTNDQIIEIGLVTIAKRKVIEEKNYLINPQIPIPEFIQKLTSIKQADIKDSPKIEEVIDDILAFIGDSILVAHNTSFDIPFLNGILEKLKKKKLENKVICTNVMTKYLIPEIMNSNLNYMSQLFNIRHVKAHRAIEDARATALLLIKYLDIFVEKNIRKINQLYYPRNKFELDRIHFKNKDPIEKIQACLEKINAPFVMSFKGEQGLLLSTIPVDKVKDDMAFLLKMIKTVKWEMLTIKLVGPFFEALLQFNNHFNKFNPEYKFEILQYLQEKYKAPEITNKNIINDIDFIVAPHLISNQLTVYSFFNLTTNNQLIFKFPGHKKKFINFLGSQVIRFEKNAKGKKKANICKELNDLFVNFLHIAQKDDKYLFVERKHVREMPNVINAKIDDILMANINPYNFPMNHL